MFYKGFLIQYCDKYSLHLEYQNINNSPKTANIKKLHFIFIATFILITFFTSCKKNTELIEKEQSSVPAIENLKNWLQKNGGNFKNDKIITTGNKLLSKKGAEIIQQHWTGIIPIAILIKV